MEAEVLPKRVDRSRWAQYDVVSFATRKEECPLKKARSDPPLRTFRIKPSWLLDGSNCERDLRLTLSLIHLVATAPSLLRLIHSAVRVPEKVVGRHAVLRIKCDP